MSEHASKDFTGGSGTGHRPRRNSDVLLRVFEAVRARLRVTFAGVTSKHIAVCCLILFCIMLTKGPRFVLLTGDWQSLPEALLRAFVLVLAKYVPILLLVVAMVNHGPRRGWAQVRWLVASIFIAQFVGIAVMALIMLITPFTPGNPLERFIDPSASALIRSLRWASLAFSELAVSASVLVCWFFLKQRAEASARLHAAQLDGEKSQRESAEARMSVMQAQIEPHFLFNTLASIRRLYETDHGSARKMLQHLSSYLTASLPTLRAAHSTLARELALAVAYLNVQQIRMGARLSVQIDVPPVLHAVAVPPMMLTTLVENAVIHGLSPLPEGGVIRILARADRDRLTIEVNDTGRGLQQNWGAGVGLANIGARLESLFGGAASLRLADGPQRGVTATIELPLAPAPQALAA